MFNWMKRTRELERQVADMQLEIATLRRTLKDIADMETPSANATTRRMARAARIPLEATE